MLAVVGPKLTDFGIARLPDSTLTGSTTVLGTPAYSAPEALASGVFGPASDQFSLAATLYEALTGAARLSRERTRSPWPRASRQARGAHRRAPRAERLHPPRRHLRSRAGEGPEDAVRVVRGVRQRAGGGAGGGQPRGTPRRPLPGGPSPRARRARCRTWPSCRASSSSSRWSSSGGSVRKSTTGSRCATWRAPSRIPRHARTPRIVVAATPSAQTHRINPSDRPVRAPCPCPLLSCRRVCTARRLIRDRPRPRRPRRHWHPHSPSDTRVPALDSRAARCRPRNTLRADASSRSTQSPRRRVPAVRSSASRACTARCCSSGASRRRARGGTPRARSAASSTCTSVRRPWAWGRSPRSAPTTTW